MLVDDHDLVPPTQHPLLRRGAARFHIAHQDLADASHVAVASHVVQTHAETLPGLAAKLQMAERLVVTLGYLDAAGFRHQVGPTGREDVGEVGVEDGNGVFVRGALLRVLRSASKLPQELETALGLRSPNGHDDGWGTAHVDLLLSET